MGGGAPLRVERVLPRTFLRCDRSAGLEPFQGAVTLSGVPGVPDVSISAFPALQRRGRVATLS
jgi:hypothetical protein